MFVRQAYILNSGYLDSNSDIQLGNYEIIG